MLTSETKTSTPDVDKVNDIKVYPNPSENIFSVMGVKVGEQVDYKILDRYGAKVQSGSIIGSDGVIDVSEIAQGLYYLVLPNQTIKVVKL